MNCPRCGAFHQPGAPACPACGTPLGAAPPAPYAAPTPYPAPPAAPTPYAAPPAAPTPYPAPPVAYPPPPAYGAPAAPYPPGVAYGAPGVQNAANLYGATAYPYVEPKTSAMAVVGLVFAFLCNFIGLVLSIIALVRINNSKGQLRGKSIAIAGIVLSAIFLVVAIAYRVGR